MLEKSPASPAVTRPLSALRDFVTKETAGGLILMAAAVLALVVANSAAGGTYFAVRDSYLGPLSLLHWINDGLMALFFLLVGLEIKRELLDGQLSNWERRVLPGVAAAGGMIVPALIYVAINWGDAYALKGWAVPAATDIAFALGVLALLGSRVPGSIKVFLTAVAILDDMGAVAIIAVFYTSELNLLPLAAALAGVGGLIGLNRLGMNRIWPYLLIGFGIWYAVLQSGVHATLAGVAVAATIPLRPAPGRPDDPMSPLHRLEHGLQPWVAYLIVPVFGFFNAGVAFAGMSPEVALGTVPLGIAAGLFFGKQIGIFGSILVCERTGLADLPAHASWRHIYGMALLCGIGFTMSLFIGALAFGEASVLGDSVKVGVLGGSLVSALVGAAVFLSAPARVRAQARA